MGDDPMDDGVPSWSDDDDDDDGFADATGVASPSPPAPAAAPPAILGGLLPAAASPALEPAASESPEEVPRRRARMSFSLNIEQVKEHDDTPEVRAEKKAAAAPALQQAEKVIEARATPRPIADPYPNNMVGDLCRDLATQLASGASAPWLGTETLCDLSTAALMDLQALAPALAAHGFAEGDMEDTYTAELTLEAMASLLAAVCAAAGLGAPAAAAPAPAPDPDPDPEPELATEDGELALGQPVTVLQEDLAGPVILAAGMKFNPPRKKRCGTLGSIGAQLADGNVKVQFETPVLDNGVVVRVDVQMMSFPRAALVAAGPAPPPPAPAPARKNLSTPPAVIQAILAEGHQLALGLEPGTPSESGAAEEEPLEIEDYTCVSPWEIFIHDVAEALRAWMRTPWPLHATSKPYRTTELTTPQDGATAKQKGAAVRLLLVHVRLLPGHLDNRTANEVFDDYPEEPGLLRTPLWGPHEAVRLCAYFGATEFIFVRPLAKMVTPDFATWLASASLVALRNTGSGLAVYVPAGMASDAEYVGGTAGVGEVGAIGRRRIAVETAPVPVEARTSGAVTTHLSFLMSLFDAKRALVGCSGGARRGPLVTEAAARFVFRCAAGGDSGRAEQLTTKHRFTLRTRWHSLPTPIESQELLADLVDPWNAPVWTLEVESGNEEPTAGRSAGIGALGAACVAYAGEFARQYGSLQGAAAIAGMHHRQAGSATEQALEREQTRGHPSVEEVGAGRLLQAVGGLITGHHDEIVPEAMVGMIRFSFSEKGLRGGALPGGCPAESLLARFAWYMGGLSTPPSARALLGAWRELVAEIRRYWDDGEMLPMGGMEDEEQPPDLASSLVHQKLQMLNACVRWRRAAGVSHRGGKHDREAAHDRETEAAELRQEHFQQAAHVELSGVPTVPRQQAWPADPQSPEQGGSVIADPQMLDVNSSVEEDEFHDAPGGETRQGGARQLPVQLVSGDENVWEPRVQLRVPTTSDRLREHEAKLAAMAMADPDSNEARARMQAGEVISDMAAFKAANPGCGFEDFVRWFSPNDWLVDDPAAAEAAAEAGEDGASMDTPRDARHDMHDDATPSPATLVVEGGSEEAVALPVDGRLSQRMQEPGNLWHNLWTEDITAPKPAAAQDPLFDYIAEAERVLHYLETVPPLSLLVQIVLAQGCAVSAFFASSPHARHRQVATALAALAQAVDALSDVHRQLQPTDDGFEVFVEAEDVVSACGELRQATLALERLYGRAEALMTELTPSSGRFGALAMERFHEELLSGNTAVVQRKSEREAVRALFMRNYVRPPVEYGYEDRVESGEGIETTAGILPRPERSEYAVVVRPRGHGVDGELAGWLTGLHGAGVACGDGATRGFHRMYAVFKQRATHFRVAAALTEGGF